MSELKTVETWSSEKGTEDWAFGAARSAFNWPRGRELSEEDYDAAIQKAKGATSSDGNSHGAESESPASGEAQEPRLSPTPRPRRR